MRLASDQQQLIEELKGPVELPWTFSKIMDSGSSRTYIDITEEGNPDTEEEMTQTTPGPKRRHVTKGPLEEVREERAGKRVPGPMRERKRPGDSLEAPREGHPQPSGESEGPSALTAYEIEVELPDSNRSFKKFSRDAVAYVCSKIRKRAVEVRERLLSPQEKEEFKTAKDKEVNNFVAAQCFELIKDRTPLEAEVMGMRWLLSWKPTEDGGKKAKARAIVLGYQDPSYKDRETSAPTPTRAGRQLFLQLCSWRRFKLEKGDVSGAFLQGEQVKDTMFCRPVEEICKAMGAPEGTVMLMRKAAYGLVQAPLQWYWSVCTFLQEIGYTKLQSEPCCWIWIDSHGQVVSAIHGHVDDFLFAGKEGCPQHAELMRKVKAKYRWGEWQSGSFIQCGIQVRQKEDFSIELDQTTFIEDLEEIHLSRDRSRCTDLDTTEGEKSAMRGLLGSLSWLCGQTCFLYAVDVNMLISKVRSSKVSDLLELNQIVRAVKKWKHNKLKVHAFEPQDKLEMICWTDAAHANRSSGDSTEGIFLGMSSKRLRDGREENITPVFWRSGKIGRVCRSPACAEIIASLDGEDDLAFLKFLWAELNGQQMNPRWPDKMGEVVPSLLVTDAKNLYDKVHKPVVMIKGEEKRSTLEAIALKSNLDRGGTDLRWVNGDSMLANSLTKPSEKGQMMLFITMGYRWRITYDELMRSGKNRRKIGLGPLETPRDRH